MTSGDTITVLCVDPTGETVPVFTDDADFETLVAGDIRTALETAATTEIDCVVAEYDLPDGTCFECFEAVRESDPNAACIIYTDVDHSEIDTETFTDTIAECLLKGSRNVEDRLVDTVRNAVYNRTQVGFPLPDDEDERLAALAEYDLDELGAVETFERLSELIGSHFDISVAFVGLVHESEERFIACHGADWERMDRDESVCTYALLEDDVTVIEDVQDDPHFEHNEMLDRWDIRSYVGANITTPDGTVLGQLCLTDDEPRTYAAEDLEDLELFAEEISEQLELRRRLDAGTKQRT